MKRSWKIRSIEAALVDSISSSLECSPLLAKLLGLRGLVNKNEIRQFLYPEEFEIPDPFLFDEMHRAVDRILQAVQNQERVLIHGDYDVDGITSTAILRETLQSIGLEADTYLPDRMGDGYGLQEQAVREFAKTYQLMITVDCGTTACDAVQAANECGMDIIITDHHDPGERRPNALAVLNPIRPDENYPSKCLSGAGVAWKLACALRQTALKGVDPDEQLELVALGMIADVMPLLNENRLLLIRALRRFRSLNRPGLIALMDRARVIPAMVTTHSLGFHLGPRLNAAGRIDHPNAALNLLLTQDEAEAKALAYQLDDMNLERRQVERKLFEEACEQIESKNLNKHSSKLLVVVGKKWHRGVLGILAQKVAQRYQKSTFIISEEDDIAIGSARAVCDADLIPLLDKARPYSLSCGGHTSAAGLKVKPENLDRFAQALYQAADTYWKNLTAPSLWLDAEVPLEQIDNDLMNELERLQPFGQCNEEPVFYSRASISPSGPRIVGNGHLKLSFQHKRGVINAIGFGQGQKIDRLNGGEVDIAFKCRFNDYNGRREINLHLEDIRPCETVSNRQTSAIHSNETQGKVVQLNSKRRVINRALLGDIYKILTKAADENKQLNHQSAYVFAQMKKITNQEFDTALKIFSELELLRIQNGKIQILEVNEKRDLSHSPTFQQIGELQK